MSDWTFQDIDRLVRGGVSDAPRTADAEALSDPDHLLSLVEIEICRAFRLPEAEWWMLLAFHLNLARKILDNTSESCKELFDRVSSFASRMAVRRIVPAEPPRQIAIALEGADWWDYLAAQLGTAVRMVSHRPAMADDFGVAQRDALNIARKLRAAGRSPVDSVDWECTASTDGVLDCRCPECRAAVERMEQRAAGETDDVLYGPDDDVEIAAIVDEGIAIGQSPRRPRRWRWMDGMLAQWKGGRGRADEWDARAWNADPVAFQHLQPDHDDFATQGCIEHGLLPEAWADPDARVYYDDGEWWLKVSGRAPLALGIAQPKARGLALLAALDAAPPDTAQEDR